MGAVCAALGLTAAEMMGGVAGVHDHARLLVVEANVAVDEPQAAAGAAIRALGRHIGKATSASSG